MAAVLVSVLGMPAQAQQRPQIETTKVDRTENVYIFRNGNHQSMFVVTKDGVIATDPIAYGRPNGGQQYVDEIKKVTDKPIKYLIYSHHHYRRQGIQGRRSQHHSAQEGHGASSSAQRPEHAAAGSDDRGQESHHARRHLGRAALSRSQSLGFQSGDSPAEGKDRFHRGHYSSGVVSGPRHD